MGCIRKSPRSLLIKFLEEIRICKNFNTDIIALHEQTHMHIYPSDENLAYLEVLDTFGCTLYLLDAFDKVYPSKCEIITIKKNFMEDAANLLLKHQNDMGLFTAINFAIKPIQLYFNEFSVKNLLLRAKYKRANEFYNVKYRS